MKRYISLVLILLFSTIAIYSQTKFTAEAPGQVIAGQRFRVVYTLTNGNGEDLKVPDFDGINILYGPARSQSSQFSIVNGKTSSTKEESYTYTVVASKEGSYTIPAATIKSEGKQYTSNTLTVKVLPNDGTRSDAQSTTSQTVAQNSGDDKTFVRMILSKNNVYEQEPILVTFKIYTKAANIRSLDNAIFPSFEGFVLQDIAIDKPQIELEHYKGVNYQVVTIKQALLYPQRAGNIEISKGDFDVTVQVVRPMQGFFGMMQGYVDIEKSISTSPETVKVKPLPSNKPASFTNAVGSFKIKSSISNTAPKANEALTYKVVISGNGNLKYIKDPELKFPADFEVYDPKTEVDVKTITSGVTGSRVIEYTVIPRSAGDFKIPAVEFSYFDIATSSYKTITSDSYELKVAKGAAGQGGTVADFTNKEDLKVLATDIKYIKGGDFDLEKETKTIFGTLIYWLYYIIPTLIFIAYIIVNRKQAQLNSNVELLKNRKANKVASKRLKVAATYLKTYNKEKFYAEVLRTIWGYISDKLTIPLSELSRENVSQELKSYGATDELVSKIINIIDLCEFAQYAPSQSNETMDKLYKESVEVIGEMENVVKKQIIMKRAYILIAILITATISSAQSLQDAADAYSKENYTVSAQIYESLADSVGVSSELYYNIGNSYYKLKNYPKAILNYERALLLSPGDEDIKFNLEMARANIVDKIDVVDRSFISIWLESMRNITSSNSWAVIAIVSFILFLIGIFVYIFGKQVMLKKIGFFGGAILLMLSIYANVASYKQKQKILERETAIIMAPSITIKSSPSESGTELFILHEGTKVKITDKVGEWSEIKIEDGNSGWIKTSEMEII